MFDPPEPEPALHDDEPANVSDPAAEVSGPLSCATCSSLVESHYYEVNGNVVCESCRSAIETGQVGGSRLGRFLRAGLFGSAAAFVGVLIDYSIISATGRRFALAAILFGYLVGAAVRAGSRRRGGWLYQALAVFLTYTTVVATYFSLFMPLLLAEAEQDEAIQPQRAAAPAAPRGKAAPERAEPGDPAHAGEAAAPNEMPHGNEVAKQSDGPAANPEAGDVPAGADVAVPADDLEAPEAEVVPPPAVFDPGEFFDALVVVIGFLYTIPIQAGLQAPIDLLITGFALWEAWKLNRRQVIVFNGPYEVGPTEGDHLG
jgi:hypothetical protein